jgi:hypothetical protein
MTIIMLSAFMGFRNWMIICESIIFRRIRFWVLSSNEIRILTSGDRGRIGALVR